MDFDEANYILGIQLFGDWKNKMIALFQSLYINKVFEKFTMQDSNKGGQPSMIGITLSLNDCPRHSRRKSILKKGSLCFGNWNFSVYGMLCTITDKDLKKSISVPIFSLCDDAIVWSIKQNYLLTQQWRPYGQPLKRLRKRFSTASSLVLLRISRYG